MANVVVVALVVLIVWAVVSFVRSRRHGLEAKRGLSIGADLAGLADTPTVTVRAVTVAGPERVRLVMAPESGPELDVVVALNEGDFGYELLREWQRSAATVAIVMPPASRIVRLRSVEDLQPVTLRRIDV